MPDLEVVAQAFRSTTGGALGLVSPMRPFDGRRPADSRTTRIGAVIVMVVASLAIGRTAWAETYYVDQLGPGDDDNDCTSESTPCVTIQGAIAKAEADDSGAGDTIYIKDGIYNEAPTVLASGSAAAPFVLMNHRGHAPVIDGTGLNRNGFCVDCNNDTPSETVSHVTIEGLEITNAFYTGLKYINADHLTIRNNRIHHNGSLGKGNGILGGGVNITIDRNLIYLNGGSDHGHGIYVSGSSYTVANNIFYGNSNTNLQLASYAFNDTVAPSELYAGFHDSLVANNTIAYAGRGTGIVVWDAGTGGGGYDPTLMHDLSIDNNILYENCEGSVCRGITFMNSQPYSNIVVRNNVSYASGAGGTSFIQGGAEGSTYTASGNSTTAHPNMANAPADLPASPDFRLTPDSTAAIDSGLDLSAVGIVTDYLGAARPAGRSYDVGAYELGGMLPGARTSPSAPTNLQVE